MAYTFKEGKMASNVLDTMLATGFIVENETHDFYDGSLVALGDIIEGEYDAYHMTVADADHDVCILDLAEISEGDINDNIYRMGNKLYDLKLEKKVPGRVRRLALHDKYWIGSDNIVKGTEEGAPDIKVGTTLIPAADGKHKTAAAATSFGAKIIAEREFTAGTKAIGKLYLVEVVSL